jgi:outer membrane protein
MRWLLPAALALVIGVGTGRAADEVRPGARGTWWGIPALPNQWNRHLPESDALRIPTPVTRDDQVREVTVKETIAIALENNPGIAARRLEPSRQEEGVLEAQSQFDPALGGDLEQEHSLTPNTNALSSVATSSVDDRTANASLAKKLRLGTQLRFDFLNERLDNNATFFGLRPQYTPTLSFSLVQPLLRDFGWDFSYLVVRVAEQTAEAARYQYEAQLQDFVQQVIETYWAVVGARENLEVQRESKALADRTVSENEARVRVGLLPPVSILEAQADAKSREEQVIIAENRLEISRQRLAQLAFFRPTGSFVPRTLEPIEKADPEEVHVDVDQALAAALVDRPEILASARDVRARQLNEKIAQNGLLPRVDLVGGYGVTGTSGRGVQTVSFTDLGGGRCRPNPNPALPGTFVCVTDYAGPATDAYDTLGTDDFRRYSFGLQIQVPLSNALARSQYARSRIARDQSELSHRDLLSNVTLEVRESGADVVAARQRIETSRVARELAAENLRNQEKRHEVGMATTKDLLDFQTRLTSAAASEVQSRIDYAVSVARWRRAQGALLAHYQIVIDQPGHGAPPWFARF